MTGFRRSNPHHNPVQRTAPLAVQVAHPSETKWARAIRHLFDNNPDANIIRLYFARVSGVNGEEGEAPDPSVAEEYDLDVDRRVAVCIASRFLAEGAACQSSKVHIVNAGSITAQFAEDVPPRIYEDSVLALAPFSTDNENVEYPSMVGAVTTRKTRGAIDFPCSKNVHLSETVERADISLAKEMHVFVEVVHNTTGNDRNSLRIYIEFYKFVNFTTLIRTARCLREARAAAAAAAAQGRDVGDRRER